MERQKIDDSKLLINHLHDTYYSVDGSDDTVMAYAVDRRGSFLK